MLVDSTVYYRQHLSTVSFAQKLPHYTAGTRPQDGQQVRLPRCVVYEVPIAVYRVSMVTLHAKMCVATASYSFTPETDRGSFVSQEE